jgi:hypothetical protein
MVPVEYKDQAPLSPLGYHRKLAQALQLDALTLVRRLHMLDLCCLVVWLARRQCPPPLPAGPRGSPRVYAEESVLPLALLCTLWRLSYQEVHDWLGARPALAWACGLPSGANVRARVPSKAQQSKRLHAAGAPARETLFVLMMRGGPWMGLSRARYLIVDGPPCWPGGGLTPTRQSAMPPCIISSLLRVHCLHILHCRGTGLSLFFRLSPANVHDIPFARLLLELATRLLRSRLRRIRQEVDYWGLKLIAWIHTVLGHEQSSCGIPRARNAARACRRPGHCPGGVASWTL